MLQTNCRVAIFHLHRLRYTKTFFNFLSNSISKTFFSYAFLCYCGEVFKCAQCERKHGVEVRMDRINHIGRLKYFFKLKNKSLPKNIFNDWFVIFCEVYVWWDIRDEGERVGRTCWCIYWVAWQACCSSKMFG